MKINFQNKIAVVLVVFLFQFSFAQKKEQIGTETVNVVKPYTPKISDAFKVKEIPELNEEANTKKETIKSKQELEEIQNKKKTYLIASIVIALLLVLFIDFL